MQEFLSIRVGLDSNHHIDCCSPTSSQASLDDIDDDFDLRGAVKVLFRLPSLEKVSIKSHHVIDVFDTWSIQQLFESQRLVSLSVKRYLLTEILPSLLGSLQNNRSLDQLVLEQVGFDDTAGVAVAKLLQSDDSSLRVLTIKYNSVSIQDHT